jgi:hypothetical protein
MQNRWGSLALVVVARTAMGLQFQSIAAVGYACMGGVPAAAGDLVDRHGGAPALWRAAAVVARGLARPRALPRAPGPVGAGPAGVSQAPRSPAALLVVRGRAVAH